MMPPTTKPRPGGTTTAINGGLCDDPSGTLVDEQAARIRAATTAITKRFIVAPRRNTISLRIVASGDGGRRGLPREYQRPRRGYFPLSAHPSSMSWRAQSSGGKSPEALAAAEDIVSSNPL